MTLLVGMEDLSGVDQEVVNNRALTIVNRIEDKLKGDYVTFDACMFLLRHSQVVILVIQLSISLLKSTCLYPKLLLMKIFANVISAGKAI